jgi:Domain of unknown function (DUF4349)
MGRHITFNARRWATAGPIIIASVLTACGGDDNDAAATQTEAAAATIAPGAPNDGGDMIATEESAPAEQSAGGGQTGIDFGQIGRDVIVELHVFMTSDDIARSVAAVTADAASLGGGIASSDVDYGSGDGSDDGDPAINRGHAVLVVRVPPDAVDRLLQGLHDTGTVVSMSQSAHDVTEQLVDLDVRISNARTSVANVREFMDQATDLNQLVMLESELTRRQTELEQLEAQQRNLGERVELATVTVEIAPTAAAPDVAEPDEKGLGDGLRSGWAAFVAIGFAIFYVVAVLAPFLVVALLAGVVAWFVLRRRPLPPQARPAEEDTLSEEPDREPATPVG